MKREDWNKCDVCGKYIALDDFDNGATRRLVTPDSYLSKEEYETLCIQHATEQRISKWKDPNLKPNPNLNHQPDEGKPDYTQSNDREPN